jgi:hypothetical protein
MITRNLSALEIVRALEANRRNADRRIARLAEEISANLARFNERPSAGNYGAELDRAETFVREHGTNPVVKRTELRAYPGWTVREYADGKFDASGKVALSPGYDTFAEAVGFAKRDGSEA